MSTSQRTFEQVKNILGKLDRDIDAARAKRLQTRATPVSAAPAMTPPPAPTPLRPLATPTASSPFGRATPMRLDQRSQPRTA